MSTLKCTNLQNASAASPAIVLAADGTATAQLSSINGGPIAGARNRIINGAMEVSQRGTSTANTGYLLDRWAATNTSAQSQSTDAPAGFINSVEFTSSSATYPYVEQRIERINSQDLATKTVTVSFWAKNVSGSSNLYVELYRANSNDNFSVMTQEAGGNVVAASPSASWTYYSTSFTLSANATTGIAVRIIRNNASAASTRITGVQLEAGPATPFERRSYGQELALCQRYFERRTFASDVQICTAMANGNNTAQQAGVLGMLVEKRASATISGSAASTFAVNSLGTQFTCNSIGFNGSATTAYIATGTASAVGTTGVLYRVVNGQTAYIDCSAEL